MLVLEYDLSLELNIKQGITKLPWRRDDEAVRRLLIRGDDFSFDFHLNLTRGKARF